MGTETAAAGAAAFDAGLDWRKWAGWIVGVGIWFLPLLAIDAPTYIVLTIAGLAMGMLLFLTASGLTLIFGLMDVLNLAHGAFFAWGAYAGFTMLNAVSAWGWVDTGTLGQSIASILLALLAAIVTGGVIGFILEKVIIRHVYGNHLKQILITMGASLIMAELIRLFWGPNDEVASVPLAFQGSFDIMDIVVNRFRVVAICVGLAVYAAIQLVLNRTKLGIIVRAGVENREIVQAIGYNINRIFAGVFAAGAALAAIGGTMWAVFSQQVYPGMGDENLIFALIIVIIGGMGSVTGSFLGAMMVGLAFNYVAFLFPKLALGVNIMIMATILLIRPKGLFGRE